MNLPNPPSYPMPADLRWPIESLVEDIRDPEVRHLVRQHVAVAYACGFHEGKTYGQTIATTERLIKEKEAKQES